jgi:hypothetical protein
MFVRELSWTQSLMFVRESLSSTHRDRWADEGWDDRSSEYGPTFRRRAPLAARSDYLHYSDNSYSVAAPRRGYASEDSRYASDGRRDAHYARRERRSGPRSRDSTDSSERENREQDNQRTRADHDDTYLRTHKRSGATSGDEAAASEAVEAQAQEASTAAMGESVHSTAPMDESVRDGLSDTTTEEPPAQVQLQQEVRVDVLSKSHYLQPFPPDEGSERDQDSRRGYHRKDVDPGSDWEI